ncbi:MAG: amidohydrolase family protein, partial [Chloroflexi bacterium]|nr:amidohydrolase family protein [Chloroflexota bacterium]
MPLDLRIDNGTLITPTRAFRAAIGCAEGRIAVIGDERDLPPARQTIDASGLLVMPGLIDPHVHMRDPGHTEREDWWHGTCAAAAGGVTCVLEHPNSVPQVTNLETLAEKQR